MAARAFDDRRAPELDLIDVCVHCGFCLPTCPTYDLWAEEMDSPRGRIVLMSTALEEGSELTPELVTHWDRCLGCMACVTACPSGVQYDKLIEDTRQQVERNYRRPLAERLWRRGLFALFPHPGRLRALMPAMALQRALRLGPLLGRSRLAARFPRLRTLLRLAPDTPLRSALARLPERTPARGERRGRVAFLRGCVQRVFFGEVNRATVRVLAAEGYEVHAPRKPRCCGALQLHTGFDDQARALARETITRFEDFDAVVVNAAGCGSAMKDYDHLFRDDDAWRERAGAFSARVRDVTELLAEDAPVAPRRPVELTAAYHDPCHLAHAQGVREQPRELLRQIPGLELREPDGWELCCGSAGVYNLLEPEAAAELGRRKAERLLATGARAVIAANPGCVLQIAAHAEELGEPLTLYHPMELLDASLGGGALHNGSGSG
ncbi:MAG TPA: heterodisulfide reductase-related iron-sulfur binding cluster [Solirubrobacterales bacterium]|nr:heterodisulfide reductase-related iron-sulfur binding cluster [Solirubrobacterales bacterium]